MVEDRQLIVVRLLYIRPMSREPSCPYVSSIGFLGKTLYEINLLRMRHNNAGLRHKFAPDGTHSNLVVHIVRKTIYAYLFNPRCFFVENRVVAFPECIHNHAIAGGHGNFSPGEA